MTEKPTSEACELRTALTYGFESLAYRLTQSFDQRAFQRHTVLDLDGIRECKHAAQQRFVSRNLHAKMQGK